jgi:hypothetical protein
LEASVVFEKGLDNRDDEKENAEIFKKVGQLQMEVDFLKKETLKNIPSDIEAAYYLIHSMSHSAKHFEDLEEQCAENFRSNMKQRVFEVERSFSNKGYQLYK